MRSMRSSMVASLDPAPWCRCMVRLEFGPVLRGHPVRPSLVGPALPMLVDPCFDPRLATRFEHFVVTCTHSVLEGIAANGRPHRAAACQLPVLAVVLLEDPSGAKQVR